MGRKRIKHQIINGIEKKYCSKCYKWLTLDQFNKNNKAWDGLFNYCRMCSKQYHINNHDRNIKQMRQWHKQNPDYNRQWYEQHPDYNRQWHKQNPDYNRQWYEQHPDYHRQWSKQNPDYRRQRYKNNPDEHYFMNIKHKYGVTYNDWNQLLDSQNNVCAICKQPFNNTGNCCVDHSHNNGVVRGIICKNCNLLLGDVSDSVSIIINLIIYLMSNNNYGLFSQNKIGRLIKQQILDLQQYQCPGCEKILTLRCHLDHNHTTNIIRGCLCSACNLALGHAKDSVSIMLSAIKYLQRFQSSVA